MAERYTSPPASVPCRDPRRRPSRRPCVLAAGGFGVRALVALLTIAAASSCGSGPQRYSPQRPMVDSDGRGLPDEAASRWMPAPGLLDLAEQDPPAALAQIDRLFGRMAAMVGRSTVWTEEDLSAEIDAIQAALDRLELSAGTLLRQRVGTLSEDETHRFREAAALTMRWALALMRTGEINNRVKGAEKLRQALEWDADNPVLILLLAGHHDTAGFISRGTELLTNHLHEVGHQDLIALQLLRKKARNWVVTRERGELDAAFALGDTLLSVYGGFDEAPAWLVLERARLFYLADEMDSVRVAATRAYHRADAEADDDVTVLAQLLVGICEVRDLDFTRGGAHFRTALYRARSVPELRGLLSWMSVPWDLWTEERRLAFDRSSDRAAFIHEYWSSDDPILATPDILEHRIEYRRRVAEAYFTLNGVDPAVPGPLSLPGKAILRFGWPRAWLSTGGQIKNAASDNPYVQFGVDRSWRFAYRMPTPFGTQPDTILFQDGGSGSRFAPVDSLVPPDYPLFVFDLDFGGRAYPFHTATARFREADGRLGLTACFDTYIPDYTVRYPLNGIQFDGDVRVLGALYRETRERWSPVHEFEVELLHETTLPHRRRLVRRSGGITIPGLAPGAGRVGAQMTLREPSGEIVALGVDNGRREALPHVGFDDLAVSDLLMVESFDDLPPAAGARRLGESVVAYGPDRVTARATPRACPLFVRDEALTFYLEAYNLARRDGRTLTEVALTLERIDEQGDVDYAVVLTGMDQMLQQHDVNQWNILRSIDLGGLEPGPYRFRATVIDHHGDAERERALAFTVIEPENLVEIYGWADLELPSMLPWPTRRLRGHHPSRTPPVADDNPALDKSKYADIFISMVDTWVEALKAMADPVRLRILTVLGREELAVGELAEVLSISQPRVSHHLRMLREAGLLRVRREGSWTFCSLETAPGNGPGPELLQLWESHLGPEGSAAGDLQRLDRVLEARRLRSRSFFDEAAERWEHLEPRFEGSGLRHQSLSMLLDDDLVLADIGCGSGFMSEELAKRARRVILVDHSPAMLERAREAMRGAGRAKLEFRLGELERLPLTDAEVDGAFVNLVLHHVPDVPGTLAELSRVIRPGGSLVVSDMLPHHEEWLREEHADLRLGMEPEKLAATARRAGFAAIETEAAVDQLRVRSRNGHEALLPLFILRARKPRPRATKHE